MVLAPMEEEYTKLIKYRLEPEISHLDLLIGWTDYLTAHTAYDPGFHLKVETGLHRLGVMESKTEELVRFLKGKQPVKMLSVFSHMAASTLADHDDFTHLQARRFQQLFSLYQTDLGISTARHYLISTGLFHFP